MEKLNKILEKVNNKKLTIEDAQHQILILFGVDISSPIEKPILVGYLNKKYGYKGFKPIEIGSPVYSFNDKYYFEITPLNDGKSINQKFYKKSLEPHIDFINY